MSGVRERKRKAQDCSNAACKAEKARLTELLSAADIQTGVADVPQASKDKPVELLVKSSSKWRNWTIRSVSTFAMSCFFVWVVMSGHLFVVTMMVTLQIYAFKEVVGIGYVAAKDKQIPWFRRLHWYFFCVSVYLVYGRKILTYWQPIPFVKESLSPVLLSHHTFVCFAAYLIGFVAFVLSLRKGLYKYQVVQFGWTHLALVGVVGVSSVIIWNIFNGLFWFVFPSTLIIINDIMAYVVGFFFGRTPLIQLSPKKTWEGFLGSAVFTLLWGMLVAAQLAKFSWMVCPRPHVEFDWGAVSYETLDCKFDPVFLPKEYVFPMPVIEALRMISISRTTVTLLPVQLHAISFALFASIAAPFGGFFASGVKRAFKLKDFGDLVPGHGGVVDRMDCQFLMGMFTFVYYTTFINPMYGYKQVLTAAALLTVEERARLVAQLSSSL